MAVGDLLQTANQVVNDDKTKVAVKVRAVSDACFEVDLTLWQEVIESIFTYADTHRDDIEAAHDLVDLAFKVITPLAGGVALAGGGLFALLKWLRGRKPDRIEESAGDIIIHIGDSRFETNAQTIKLAESASVRAHARKLVSALERNGIDSIAARQPGSEELVIDRSDVESFDIPDGDEELIEDKPRKMTLQIISLSFKEDNKWRLTDGAEPFTADIEDGAFLKRIANDEISFGKDDYLVCIVRERQTVTSKGLKKERTITQVIEHKPAARQLRLM